jgi:hypothetical protein
MAVQAVAILSEFHPGQWLMPVILATQKAKMRVQSQPRQIVLKILSRKNSSWKRADGVAQGVGPEFKPQYLTHTHKKKSTPPSKFSSKDAPQNITASSLTWSLCPTINT